MVDGVLFVYYVCCVWVCVVFVGGVMVGVGYFCF